MIPTLTEEQKKNLSMLCDALESGDYKQGQSRLVQFDKKDQAYHCCLGVAMDLCGLTALNTGKEEDDFFEGKFFLTETKYMISYPDFNQGDRFGMIKPNLEFPELGFLENQQDFILEYVPEMNSDHFIRNSDHFIRNGKSYTFASRLNDSGFTFKEIAAILRKQYLES